MTGIYIIKNKINDLVYIGQSIDIQRRWSIHWGLGKKDANPNRLEYNNQIHTAMRKLGRENFYMEILEECPKEKLNEKEIYWIKFYNSYKKGYNGTEGGEFYNCSVGEQNGRALLTEEDVYYIRECYNNHIPFRDVYKIFSNKISKRGLQKIWHFENWKYICPEYNTLENKEWHKTKAKALPSEMAKNNQRCFSPEEVRKMRDLFNQGISIEKIWKVYYPNHARSTVYNAIKKITYQDID